jgi:hypothetical protein
LPFLAVYPAFARRRSRLAVADLRTDTMRPHLLYFK